MDAAEVPHPTIVTRERPGDGGLLLRAALQHPGRGQAGLPGGAPRAPRRLARDARSGSRRPTAAVSKKNIQEVFHDALYYRDEARALFLHGGAHAARAGPGRADLLEHHRADPQGGPGPQARAGGAGGPRRRAHEHLLRQLLACSSPCPTCGPSSSSSRSCPSTGSRSARATRPSSPTSPATPTARSSASSTCTTWRAGSRCTTSCPARTTSSACSWSAPTRRPSATCTTSSATPTS